MSYVNFWPIQTAAFVAALRARRPHDINVFPVDAPFECDRLILVSPEVRRAVKAAMGGIEDEVKLRMTLPTAGADARLEAFESYDKRNLLWSMPLSELPDPIANALKFELMWKLLEATGNNPIPLV
ncbi:hypothetical protein D869_gp147 [Caulobacter phage CcrRogue]|uniref:Uncharacterized protein n=1 Tax=Caulobacter phage CcrRogue TaxID=2927986 RepID=K4K3E8_9CAUD|nr:hypothetical protein D869_gp147 [Caulobacter phage CcrRogue]AFU86767.1 hypothetical protein CcrRogue_gp285 [Caulobacter phage CcrRogue]